MSGFLSTRPFQTKRFLASLFEVPEVEKRYWWQGVVLIPYASNCYPQFEPLFFHNLHTSLK